MQATRFSYVSRVRREEKLVRNPAQAGAKNVRVKFLITRLFPSRHAGKSGHARPWNINIGTTRTGVIFTFPSPFQLSLGGRRC